MTLAKSLSEQPTLHSDVALSNAELGAWTEIGAGTLLENTEFGDYSYCGPLCIFQNARVQRFSNIAAAVRVGPTMHPIDRPTQHHFTYRRRMYGFAEEDDDSFFRWREAQRTVVGHDTWIGHGAIIMPKVTVGTGAVIGAGAVVTRDIPPYAVAVGVPAKVVRRRFSEDQAEALERIGWWNWSHETIAERLEDFSLSVEEFVEKYGGRA
mgnify:CR=1 FL=1